MSNIYTAAEATKLWGLGESTIRSAIRRGQFKENEVRKSGRIWLIKESAMKRLYGEPKKKLDIDAIEAILEIQNLGIDFESFESGDELADWLDGRYFPEFDEPVRVLDHQREVLNEIYKQR